MYQSLLNEDYAYRQKQYHSNRRMSYGDHFSSSSIGSISSRENSPYSGNLEYYEPSFVCQNPSYYKHNACNCHYQQQVVTVNAFDNLYGNTGFDYFYNHPSKGNMVHSQNNYCSVIMHSNPMTAPFTVKNQHSQLYAPVTARHTLPELSPDASDCTPVAPIVASQLPICGDLYQNFMMFSPLQQDQHQYRPLPITRQMSPAISERSSSPSSNAALSVSEEFTDGSIPQVDYALQQLLELLPNANDNKDSESNKKNQSLVKEACTPNEKIEQLSTGGKTIKTKSTRAKRDEVCKGITKTRKKSINSHNQDSGKQFLCDEDGCGKVFRRSEHLKRHTRSIHTKEKPYVCPSPGCGKKFARTDNLSQHIRVHRPKESAASKRS